jgi:drug/metabolite transporter (DMT)-like permease
MLALCITGATGHYLLIKTYEVAEASAVQPFAYLQLVFVSVIGLFVFHEDLRTNVVIGAGLVISAGVFALWRAHRATA